MIKNINKKTIILLQLLFLMVAIFLWSTLLYVEWGTDFGIYYSGSYFITTILDTENNFKLYSEFFEHKGPIYYFFLRIIGEIIGWGHHQAVISLYLSLLIFYIPIFIYVIKSTNSLTSSFFLITLSLLLLTDQPTNSSIIFFQMGLLLISFYFLIFNRENRSFIFLSIFFFNLSVLTKIDSIIFVIPYFVFFYFKIKSSNDFNLKILVFYFICLPIILILLLKNIYGFSIYEFYDHNINFNLWYKNYSDTGNFFYDFLKNFYRPDQFSAINKSFLLPIFIFILASYAVQKNNQKKIKFEKNELILFGIILSGGIILFNSFSKDYHLLVLSAPILFFIIYNFRFLSKLKFLKILFIPVFLYAYFLQLGFIYADFNKKLNCVHDPFCDYSSQRNYIKTIESIKKDTNKVLHLIGGNGWIYFFSSKEPEHSPNDWWYYHKSNKFENLALRNSYNNLLKKEKGFKFWIDNSLLENKDFKESSKIINILKKSNLIENQGVYSMYEIN